MVRLLILSLLFGSFAEAQSVDRKLYNQLVQEMNAIQLNPYAHYTGTDLEMIARSLPSLKVLYDNVSGLRHQFVSGGENPGYRGYTRQLKDGTIYLQVYGNKANLNRDIVLTLGHELVHATHIALGFERDWVNMMRDSITGARFAECQSEVGAYSWSLMHSPDARGDEFYSAQIATNQRCVQGYLSHQLLFYFF